MADQIDQFYRAPESSVDVTTADNAGKIWRNASSVVVTRETIWPKRCIKCNASTDKSVRRVLVYINPWIYLSILVNILLMLILGLIFQKKFKMDIPVCEKHIANRKQVILINWLLFLVMILGIWLTAADVYNYGILLSGVVLLAMMIYGLSNRLAYVAKYKDPYIHVKGAKSEFLKSLDSFKD